MTKIAQTDPKSNSVTLNDQETVIGVTNNTDITVSSHVNYTFKSRHKNPDWSIEKFIPFRSCLIHNNASRIETDLYVSNIPKWLTILEREEVDSGTGEILYSDYATDDFKSAKNRKIKMVRKFCDYYEPLYRRRKVSILFHTFTRMDFSKQDMRTMVECAKARYKAINRPIRGYLWALELADNEGMETGYHIHYHLVVAIDRLRVEEMPKELKFEDLWGQRTQVEFIKKSIRAYLSKYLYKSDAKIIGKRSYSISRNLT